MGLPETYKIVSEAIVAIIPKYVPADLTKELPPIIGTGFLVAEGVVVTNYHVLAELKQLPTPPGTETESWPIEVKLFRMLEGGFGMIPIEVLGAAVIELQHRGYYYGPRRPDFVFIHVKVKGHPTLSIKADPSALQPGVRIATAGFPMGRDALLAPGWAHQFTPTLQEGIISAVLPFPCDAPHAIMANVMIQGGASGSPVFLHDSPAVIGVLFGSLIEPTKSGVNGVTIDLPTNFSYFVPGHYLQRGLEAIGAGRDFDLPEDTMTLDEIIATMPKSVPQPQQHLRKTAVKS